MKHRGFTLIELMIVVAIIAIVAAIAIPGLLRSRISSAESSAIASLKAIASAQTQFKTTVAVDCDGDGEGEYGFLSELAAISGLRVAGGVSANRLEPPGIAQILGNITLSSSQKSSYEYRMYLPTAGGAAIAQASSTPPNGVALDASEQEGRFACYAWPQSMGESGQKIFMINQSNAVIFSINTAAGQNYTSKTTTPNPEAGFDAAGADPDNLDAALARGGVVAGDGGNWATQQ